MRTGLRFSVIIFVASFYFNCGNHSHPDKKIFRYNESSGITSLDPLKATNLPNIWPVQQMYEGLTAIDSNGVLQPLLAESWTVTDSMKTYAFRLKNHVFFHQDACFENKRKKFSAYDVLFTYRRVLGSSSSWILQNIVQDETDGGLGIEITDSFSIVFSLKEPSATFPQMLAIPQCGIVPEEAVKTYGSDFRRHPVGTGPFMFHQWHEGEKLILHKNANYHISGLPIIDGISISQLKDKQTVLLEFIRGNFDFISGIDAAYKDELLTGDGALNPAYSDKIRLQKLPYLNTEYLGILLDSTSKSPLQNVHVRKALNYGVDRDRLVKYIRNGIGIPGHHGMVPPVLKRHGDLPPGFQYNEAMFLAELKLAGYQSPSAVPEIVLNADVAYTDVCTFIINKWNELGLHVKLEILDRPTLKSEVAKGNLAFFRASWIADYPDPENYLSLFYGPLKSPAGPNYTHYSSEYFDFVFEQIGQTQHDSLRNALCFLHDQVVFSQSPVIILYYDQVVRFTQKRVEGLPAHPMNYLDLRSVKLN